MKLASQQDTASPRTQAACSRAGTGRRTGALLAAIKSLAADIAAIKLAVVACDDGQQVSQAPGPALLARAATSSSPARHWGGNPESKLARLWAKPTGVVPLLQQGRSLPTRAPYAPASLAHDYDMRARPAEEPSHYASHPSRQQKRVSRSRPAAANFSTAEAFVPADDAWPNGAPATAPPLPPEWGLRAEDGNGAAHTSAQPEEWGGVVLVPGRGRLPTFFSHDVRRVGGVSPHAHPRLQAMGQTVSWAVALEAALDSDRDGASLAATR
jgi:hypothetical protein